jgi:hypothetical protein
MHRKHSEIEIFKFLHNFITTISYVIIQYYVIVLLLKLCTGLLPGFTFDPVFLVDFSSIFKNIKVKL